MTIIEGLTQVEKDILNVIIKWEKANKHRVPYGFSHTLPYNELGASRYSEEDIKRTLERLVQKKILNKKDDGSYILTEETFNALMKKMNGHKHNADKHYFDENVLAEIEKEFSKWKEFLNITIGLFSFNLAISCLGTKNPKSWAFVSFIFVGILLGYGNKYFPQKIKELRKAELNKIDKLTLKGLEVEYFGLKNFWKHCPLYLLGFLFLALLALGVIKG